MPSSTKSFVLPKTLEDWPWQAPVPDPAHTTIIAECEDWIQDFFGPHETALANILRKTRIGLLCSMMYPSLNEVQLRMAIKFTLFTIVLDEVTDPMTGDQTKRLLDTLLHREFGSEYTTSLEWIDREFWTEVSALAEDITPYPETLALFREGYKACLDGVVNQAYRRDIHQSMPEAPTSLDQYLSVRRGDVAGDALFALIELNLDIPPSVREGEELNKLRTLATDLFILNNDLLSFRKEYLVGDAHNAVSIIMQTQEMSIQDAVNEAARLHQNAMDEFLLVRRSVMMTCAGPEVDAYIDGLGAILSGSVEWAFQTPRYFGKEGRRVKESRVVRLE